MRWDLTKLDETAKHLKAVIKNMPCRQHRGSGR